MSRPQKIHPPIKGGFNNILASVATGSGASKDAAKKAAQETAIKNRATLPKKKS